MELRMKFALLLALLLIQPTFAQTDDPEPKDPGEEGKITLLGIDSDKDGVRDDVEIWINQHTSDPKIRRVLKIYIKKKGALLDFKDIKNSESLFQEERMARQCVLNLVDGNEENELLLGVGAQFMNKLERTETLMRVSGRYIDKSLSLMKTSHKNFCEKIY